MDNIIGVNIIFLDIDGVLATPMACRASGEPIWSIDPTKIKALAVTCREAEVYWVISSTWRKHRQYNTFENFWFLLDQYGCADRLLTSKHLGAKDSDEVWRTPDLGSKRGEEIEAWLGQWAKYGIDDWLIIDDDSDMLYKQGENFLNTDGLEGLTYRDILRIENFFLGKTDWKKSPV